LPNIPGQRLDKITMRVTVEFALGPQKAQQQKRAHLVAMGSPARLMTQSQPMEMKTHNDPALEKSCLIWVYSRQGGQDTYSSTWMNRPQLKQFPG
jgi:hypothetical protein